MNWFGFEEPFGRQSAHFKYIWIFKYPIVLRIFGVPPLVK
jgi:hypothetical protein